MKRLCFLLLCFFSLAASAQTINPELLKKDWDAQWIHVDKSAGKNLGVFHFRKTFHLTTKPTSFIVHVSADNRYKLYINGQMVSLGPARGDMFHWNFETVDIAPYLQVGNNVAAAVVWQFAELRPMAQISFRTGFILQGNSATESILNTNATWKCTTNEAYDFQAVTTIYSYYVAGPQEYLTAQKYPWGWEQRGFDDSRWKNAATLQKGQPKEGTNWSEWWFLVPRPIPPLERIPTAFKQNRWATGVALPPNFPSPKTTLTVPPQTKLKLLLDQQELVNGYPSFSFSGGGLGGSISLTYAESFHIDEGTADWRSESKKPNRNIAEGKVRISGPTDKIWLDDGSNRNFESLWLRCFRYVQIEIETTDKVLEISNLHFLKTAYPFEKQSRLVANAAIEKIEEVGWRTARLDALETYMDCPYYEQIQYVGDTRIQALISYYNANDDQLARNAIQQFNNSRLAEGITQSRFPVYVPQEIPPFSLWWIAMVHDFWRYRADNQFVKKQLAGTRQVLDWFMNWQNADGSLKKLPYWNFTDWSEDPNWPDGRPPTTAEGLSANLDLQLLWALQLATDLETNFGSKELAATYRQKAAQLQQTIKKLYWDNAKKLFSDTPEKKFYSQHANVLAVLTNTVKGQEAKQLIERILDDKSLMPCSIYFKYYLHLAVRQVGLGDKYLDLLAVWQQHIDYGLTTFGEMTDPARTRSDCHAWSAHPNIEFYRIMLGIDTDAPNFERVVIQPHLCGLRSLSGSMPHLRGNISVSYQLNDSNQLVCRIELPPTLSGRFVWKNKSYPLKSGLNLFTI